MSGSLCIFAKPPVAGRSKTRLAATLGDDRAADLARAFLEDTVTLARATGERVVLATTDIHGAFGDIGDIDRVDQGNGGLGERIERVLRAELERADWAMALGADSPGLPAQRLLDGMEALAVGRSVLGPTLDGGFYVLGLTRCPAGLLHGVDWSTEATADQTWRRLLDLQLDPLRLAPWFDIDHASDLERFRASVPVRSAPRTWAALES